MTRRTAVGALGLLVFWPLLLDGQTVVQVSDSLTCQCELRAHLLVTLSDADGRAGLASPTTMARLADGRFLLVPSTQQDRILLFSAQGTFERQIGRSGQGPGEYLAVLKLEPIHGDSVVILDPGNGRLTVLSPTLLPVRTAQLPVRGGQVESLADGSLLLLGGLSGIGEPRVPRLHLLDPSFTLVRSFMQEGTRATAGSPSSARRRMTATSGGTIAAVHLDEYVVEIWTSEGEHLKTLHRAPEWFPSAAERENQAEPPPPSVGDPFFDSDGRLWTITFVADENWPEGVRVIQGPNGPLTGPSLGTANQYQDSRIEVLDIRTNGLLASFRFDPVLRFMLDDGLAASYREDERGNPFVDVWELEISGP